MPSFPAIVSSNDDVLSDGDVSSDGGASGNNEELSDHDASEGDAASDNITPNDNNSGSRIGQDAANTLGGYVKTRQELLQTLSNLHETGVQNELDLPQIVVIGSQSVGKSSLIESIAGIKLPRDIGTCTRCSTTCHVKRASSWCCRVLLVFDYDSDFEPLPSRRVVPFGPSLNNNSEVEKTLRRAQRALLCPTLDPSLFLDDSDLSQRGPKALRFTPNSLWINIRGPNLPDMFFQDLPGIIANVSDGGSEQDIRLVEALAKNAIETSNSIILLVLSCETDFENQGAGRLVLNNLAFKKRTVGVLTKVDRIESGAEEKWANLVRGTQNPLPNGWFCVKQPDLKELRADISWEDAKAAETVFFNTVPPWSQLGSHRKRLGSSALASQLSDMLSDLVQKQLPVIRVNIDKQLASVEAELADLLKPSLGDPKTEVVSLLRDFDRKLSIHVDAVTPSDLSECDTPALMHKSNMIYGQFKEAIAKTAPQFRPWSSKLVIEQSKLKALIAQATSFDGGPNTKAAENTEPYYLENVTELTNRYRKRELPGDNPPAVKHRLIAETVKPWKVLAIKYFEEIHQLINDDVYGLIREHFKAYMLGGLHDVVKGLATGVIQKRHQYTLQMIENLCNLEVTPWTQNDHYYLSNREKYSKLYQSVYRASRGETGVFQASNSIESTSRTGRTFQSPSSSQVEHTKQILAGLAGLGIHGVKADDFVKLLPADFELAPALEIMAEVRAYFQVAYKRFSDNVPLQIHHSLVRGLDRDIDLALMSLDLNHDQCVCG
ncbi:hypothetical protein FRB95_014553 [Tulasnella sp. JGI-2019a]|nr:hypothetical protein FRB95_014553 [Tulasnella sp. JGI-2019a]